MSWVATALCGLAALAGAIGVVWPDGFLSFARSFETTSMLFAAAAFRVLLGATLVLAAPSSRIPTLIRAIGVVVIGAGLVLLLAGTEPIRVIVEWAAGIDPGWIRLVALLPLALGSFLVWAVAPRPRAR